MTLALFRLIEAVSGHVSIDDINIGSLGLHYLRNKVNILPQGKGVVLLDPISYMGRVSVSVSVCMCASVCLCFQRFLLDDRSSLFMNLWS